MSRLLIFGAGGHGAVVAESALASRKWKHVAFLDDRYPELNECVGIDVIGNRGFLCGAVERTDHILIALGASAVRAALVDEVRSKGFQLATVIHPFSSISQTAMIGAGSMVMPGVVINARARIGLGSIINTGATIDHDCSLGDFVHIGPGAHLAASVRIGDSAWIGIGASIREGTTIGKQATIGAGAAVVTDIRESITAVGVPARPITQTQ